MKKRPVYIINCTKFDNSLEKLNKTIRESRRNWQQAKFGWANLMENILQTERKGGVNEDI